MTISYVSASSVESDSLTLPTHAAGDLILLVTYKTTNVLPAIPSGWASIYSATGSGHATVVAFKVAGSASETTGTWTDATHLSAVVYRSGKVLTIGNFTAIGASAGSGGTISYPAVTGPSGITNKWHIGIVQHRSNNTDCEVAPTGMTNRTSLAGASAGEVAIHDTNANSAEWIATTYTLTAGTSAAYRGITMEIREMDLDVASGGGASVPLIGPGGLVF